VGGLTVTVHAYDVIADIDTRVSDRLSTLGASMGFFWFCVALDLLAIPGVGIQIAQAFGATLPKWVSALSVMVILAAFLSQTVIQLLMLPVLQNSANKTQAHAEAIANATFLNSQADTAALGRIEALLQRTPAVVPDTADAKETP